MNACIIFLFHTSLKEIHTQISPPPQSNKHMLQSMLGLIDREEEEI